MAYEVFDNKAARLGSPVLTITTDGRLMLNADAGDILRGVGARSAHLMWDADARKIALRPLIKPDSRSYKITLPSAHKRGMSITATAFLRHIGWPLSERVTLPVAWNGKEKILEAVLPKAEDQKQSVPKRRIRFI